MMPKLSASGQYQAAFKALEQLKNSGIERDRLQPIALYLLYTSECDCPERMPLALQDPRDRAVTLAFERAWHDANTEDDDEFL
jgi:hypothetical protein